MTGDHEDRRAVPTVSRVLRDTLVELVYDPERRKTALAVSRFDGLWNLEHEVKVETGETLVPYAPTNNLIARNCVRLPSTPEESGGKAALLADIEGFFHRYVDLSPAFEKMATHYVLLTWLHDAFAELPYLRFRGDFGTGKTRALLVLGSLCYKAFFASGASTVSPIFHVLDTFGGTLILDEADFTFSDATADIVKILNNGTVKGIPLLRTLVSPQREFNPRAFNVFGPKIIAMREGFSDQALESRFLTEEMGVRTLRADIPTSIPPSFQAEALRLRNRLLHFRFCEYFKTGAATATVAGVSARLNQSIAALLALVDDDGVRQNIIRLAKDTDVALRGERQHSVEGELLQILLEGLAVANGPGLSVGEITKRYNAKFKEENSRYFSERAVGQSLRTRLRVQTRKSHGTFVVPKEEMPKIDVLGVRYGLREQPGRAPGRS